VTVKGLQLDAYGALLKLAGDEDNARRAFDRRLAEPHTSTADSATTFLAAVTAFNDTTNPTHLAVAEEYVKRLDALPRSASLWKCKAHAMLTMTHYALGNVPETGAHGMAMINAMRDIAYRSREQVWYSIPGIYQALADMYRGQPDGDVKLAVVAQRLRASALPPAELVALDSTYDRIWKEGYLSLINMILESAARSFPPAPPMPAMAWMNTADTGAHPLTFNDGAVHVVAMCGDYEAMSYYLPPLERLLKQFPAGFRPSCRLQTTGFWASLPVAPREEVAHVRQIVAQQWPTGIPLHVWAGEKRPNPEGGMVSEPDPIPSHFHGPVVVIDKKGLVRQTFPGLGRDEETRIAALVKRLLAEGA
jgi:hypothetical protein